MHDARIRAEDLHLVSRPALGRRILGADNRQRA
jgi:hypothetical protein